LSRLLFTSEYSSRTGDGHATIYAQIHELPTFDLNTISNRRQIVGSSALQNFSDAIVSRFLIYTVRLRKIDGKFFLNMFQFHKRNSNVR
jgi:hypothetical protein